MKERAIIELQKKYEYLNFNDTVVLSCLNDAIHYMEKVSPDTLANNVVAMMEIEYHFLHFLVLQMQKGNKEIYDAIFIGMEPIFLRFKSKRPDLVTGLDEQEQRLLCECTFKKMIDEYDDKQRLSSLFMKYLINNFKMITDRTGDVSFMKYNIKSNNLFETFSGYSKEAIEFVMSTFRSEILTTSLFVRQFGPSYDGVNANKDLAYYEKMRLESALTRFEQRLKYVSLMVESGKTFKDLRIIFRGKKDYEIDKIVSTYQKKEENVVIFKSLSQIKHNLKITDKELDDFLYELSNSDIKLVFKYTYGIGVKPFEDYKIMDMLKINEAKYKKYLKIACDEISKLSKKKKEEKIKKEKVKVKENPVLKPAIRTEVNEEVSSKIEKKPEVEIEKNINTNKKQHYFTFFERFYPENASEEEKEAIDKKVYEIFNSIDSYELGKEAAIRIFGSDLKTITVCNLSKEERVPFNNLVLRIRILLNKKEVNNLERKNTKSRKKKFIEYLYDENMSLEEKEALEKLLIEKLDFIRERGPKSFELAQKMYGENLDQELSDYHLERNEGSLFSSFVISTKNILKKKPKEKPSKKLKQSFYEYFYKEDMTLEERAIVREKVKKALLFNNDAKSYDLLYEVYDENLELKQEKEVSRIIKTTITKFVLKIIRTMNLDLTKRSTKKVYNGEYLFEYFYTNNMALEEKENLKNELLKIFEYLKYTNVESYRAATCLYGEDLTEKRRDITLNPTQKANFNNFKLQVRKYLGKEVPDIKNLYISYPKRPNKFNMYFYKYGMTDEEKSIQNEKIKAILIAQKNSLLKGYELAQKLYGEDLNSELNPVEFTTTEKSAFRNFVLKLKSILEGKMEVKHSLQFKRTNSKKQTFFDYFYTDDMSLEKREEIKIKVIEFVRICNLNGAKVAYSLYGPNLDNLTDLRLDSSEMANISSLRREIRDYLNGKEKRKYHIVTKAPTFFDHFYTDDMTDIEKNEVKNEVLKFMKQSALAGVSIAYRLYGEDLSTYNSSIELAEKERLNFSWLKRKIGKKLEEILIVPDKGLIEMELPPQEEKVSEDNSLVEAAIEEFTNIVDEKQNDSVKQELEEINYLDSIILKAYDCFQDHDLILSKLKISESVLIDCYIRHLSHFKDLDEILDYIIETDSNSISKILSSDYFTNFGKYLTEKEQEVIYLLLLSKQNKKIDISMISMITGVDEETLNNYRIMTPDDELNKLYEYIKR